MDLKPYSVRSITLWRPVLVPRWTSLIQSGCGQTELCKSRRYFAVYSTFRCGGDVSEKSAPWLRLQGERCKISVTASS